MKVTLLHLGLFACFASPAVAVSAQEADESALDALDTNVPKPPVVKQQPPGALELQDAVRRIAQRPTDSYALTDAGYAAIKLGDYDAAFNFLTKANALQPSDVRIKTGLGIAQVRRENPFEALSLFDEAIRLGASERSFALDRALAFDLLGNFDRAERDYATAASFAPGDELTLRHAISLSLSGRRDEADRMLIPMLQKEDPQAWRARAMMLAARGDHNEAEKIAQGFLSDSEARRMDGYFRNMPRLTVAQQAAAMHFGHFPVGSDIGEDSNSVRTLAAATGAKPVPATGDSRLIPSGEPLGTKPTTAKPAKQARPDKKDKKDKDIRSDGIATASAQQAIDAASRAKVTTVAGAKLPPPEAARPPVRIALPALAKVQAPQQPPLPKADAPSAELPATGPAVIASAGAPKVALGDVKPPPIPATLPEPIIAAPKPDISPGFISIDPATVIDNKPTAAVAEAQTPPPVTIAEPVTKTVIGPGLDGKPVENVAVVVPSPILEPAKPTPTPVAVEEKPFDLGAVVAAIDVPEEQKKPSVAPVDLKKIQTAQKPAAAAEKADAAKKGAKPAINTPRIFVQIATGADANGLGYDYKRMAKKYGALFANKEGWTAAWGKTKRLLVGPFPDLKSAKKWEADFRKAGGEGFVWQSDKNAEIDKLKGK
jgi:Flp pilus assembly protein TadD